ncbi:MAG TPA: hypothetical protein VET85_00985 [Stellaceae bacterium]|nr:hypothetical protein [Stellaceae bacterium]
MTFTILLRRSRLTLPGLRTGAESAGAARRGGGPPRWRSLIAQWLANRRARRELGRCLALDARFARDIGLTPDEIAAECRAPFWRAVPLASQPTMEMLRW